MVINLTLIVQIIHFFIAYMLISRLVLKPGLALVQQEQNEKQRALQRVAAEQAVAADKQEIRKQRWKLCQEYFNEHKPLELHVARMRTISSRRQVQIEPLDKQQLENLMHVIVKKLKAKVAHG